MRTFLALVALTAAMSTASHAAPPPDDSALWLEDVTGARALDWVHQQDSVSTQMISHSAGFEDMRGKFLEILDSNARIPAVTKYGDLYYNFWRDRQHPRGLWRRTTLDEYKKAEPAWETVLDLDALSASEKENWVWGGADVLPPADVRCLISLSRGGADAHVIREFDLSTKSFVEGGFELPESKSDVNWIDQDHVYVGVAFDASTVTTSGYPRTIKLWTRGTPVASATPVYEGQANDVSINAFHTFTPGFERDFVQRSMSFYTNVVFLVRDGKLVKVEKPEDVDLSTFREWFLFQPRKAWTLGGHTWPGGSLLAAKADDWMAGKHELQAVFTPTARVSLDGTSATKNTLLLHLLDNVRSRIEVVKFENGQWTHAALPGLPEFGTISAGAVDRFESDDYWLTITDFLTPSSLLMGSVGGGPAEKLKQSPAFFDASNAVVTQHEAVSKDGTKIPYFEVAPKNLKLDGTAPTMLTGYGGFEVSELPYYSGVQGKGWIERGGVMVVANIRGGGEFGPSWHEAGVKANRHHCYEDFIAVGEDLVKRKVTSPAHLGCIGGSNGGLLVGNMLTMRPDLFGAVVCEAPLLDMQRYHKLLAGASWMGEYGNPDDPKEWAFIREFSPYHNLKKETKYPPVLFTSSTRDDRVHPGHARRMVYRMLAQGHENVWYYENVEGGHAGAANNPQRAFMSALAYQFLWDHLSRPLVP